MPEGIVLFDEDAVAFRRFRRDLVGALNGATRITHDIALVFLHLASNDDDLGKLTRYDRSLERSMLRAVYELRRCQSRRERQCRFGRLTPSSSSRMR